MEYEIRRAALGSVNYWGVVLLVQENDVFSFAVKKKVVGPNVVSCKILFGRRKKR